MRNLTPKLSIRLVHLFTAIALVVTIFSQAVSGGHGGMRIYQLVTSPEAILSPFFVVITLPILAIVLAVIIDALTSLKRPIKFISIAACTLSGILILLFVIHYWRFGGALTRAAFPEIAWVAYASVIYYESGTLKRWQAKTRRGICPNCGYDLRATTDRCPECGTLKGSFGPTANFGED